MEVKGLLTERIVTPATSNNSLSPTIKCHGDSKCYSLFKGRCLKHDKAFFYPSKESEFILLSLNYIMGHEIYMLFLF